MNQKGNTINTILIIILTALLVGVGVYFIATKKPSSQKASPGQANNPNQTQSSSAKQLPSLTKPNTVSDEAANWKTYRNEKYGFEVKYPKGSKLQEGTRTRFAFDLSVNLPFTPDTKLTEKRMSIVIKENSTSEDCFGLIKWHGITKINGIEFHYIPGYKWEHAMGGKSFFASDYRTMKDNNCISLEFRLGLTDPTGFVDSSVPIPADPPKEDLDTKVFNQILSTFKFIK